MLNTWGPPRHPTLENVATALADGRLLAWTWNSGVVTLLSVAACTVISALAAYAFTQMIMIVIPPVIMIIPLFILMVNVNLVNTYWSTIIYAGLMIPFSIDVLTNVFRTVPREILDSGHIDGCSRLRTFTALILPLSMPVLVTLVVVNALYVWNELLIALTFLQDGSVRTLMVGLTEFKGCFFNNLPLIMTGALIATISMVLVHVAG